MRFDDTAVVLVKGQSYRISLWFMTLQSWKIIRQRIRLNSKGIVKKSKKKVKVGKGRIYYAENKKRLQLWLVKDDKDYLTNKKLRKENMIEIDIIICLKKTNRN